jgi:hypothetical protein
MQMTLTIDLASANRQLSDDEMQLWASTHSVFVSSVMGELAAERRALAEALQAAGLTVRWFEEFGGRDDDAERAYLAEVAGSDIYIGVLADEYGAMMADGFSATTRSSWKRAGAASASPSGRAVTIAGALVTPGTSSVRCASFMSLAHSRTPATCPGGCYVGCARWHQRMWRRG